jgi:hypothetical protein
LSYLGSFSIGILGSNIEFDIKADDIKWMIINKIDKINPITLNNLILYAKGTKTIGDNL